MEKHKQFGYLLSVFLIFLAFVPVVYGDLYWESTVETGGAPEGVIESMPEEIRDQMRGQFQPKRVFP